MIDYDEVIKYIYNTIDDINMFQDEGLKLEKNEETVLMGRSSKLDSIGFINLIADLEERLNDQLKPKVISILNEKVMYTKSSPFKTIKSLANYIMEQYAEM